VAICSTDVGATSANLTTPQLAVVNFLASAAAEAQYCITLSELGINGLIIFSLKKMNNFVDELVVGRKDQPRLKDISVHQSRMNNFILKHAFVFVGGKKYALTPASTNNTKR